MANATPVGAPHGLCRLFANASLALATMVVAAPLAQAQTSGTAASSTPAAPATPPPNTAAAAVSSGAATAGELSKADQAFMRQLTQANLAEVAAAKIAQQKASSDSVKAYARQMIDDHTSAQNELQTLADAKGVTLPKAPDAAHQAAAKKLQGLSGAAFDRSYAAQAGTADHRAAVRLFTQVSTKATDPDLKAFGAKLLPKVQSHLDMVQQMKAAPKAMPQSAPQAKTAG